MKQEHKRTIFSLILLSSLFCGAMYMPNKGFIHLLQGEPGKGRKREVSFIRSKGKDGSGHGAKHDVLGYGDSGTYGNAKVYAT